MAKLKPFDCGVLQHPTEEEEKKGQTTLILVPFETIMATEESWAKIIIGRKIPETAIEKHHVLEVVVRPFRG